MLKLLETFRVLASMPNVVESALIWRINFKNKPNSVSEFRVLKPQRERIISLDWRKLDVEMCTNVTRE